MATGSVAICANSTWHREVEAQEPRKRWLPYAVRWHGPALRLPDVDAEFDRVARLVESGEWPDPTYVQR